jgi:hypothetical protein
MWMLLAWTIVFMAVGSMPMGILLGFMLHWLAGERATQIYSSKRGIVGLVLGGSLVSVVTALASLVFRPLLQIPLAPFWSLVVHVIAVTAVGVLGAYSGTWATLQLVKKR